jgi:hypothetical protein
MKDHLVEADPILLQTGVEAESRGLQAQSTSTGMSLVRAVAIVVPVQQSGVQLESVTEVGIATETIVIRIGTEKADALEVTRSLGIKVALVVEVAEGIGAKTATGTESVLGQEVEAVALMCGEIETLGGREVEVAKRRGGGIGVQTRTVRGRGAEAEKVGETREGTETDSSISSILIIMAGLV